MFFSTSFLRQLEDELRLKDEMREQMAAAERRAMVLAGELEELRTQLEASERARKSAESEMNDAVDRVSELLAANASLTTAKRKLEVDIQAMQVCFNNLFVFIVFLYLPSTRIYSARYVLS